MIKIKYNVVATIKENSLTYSLSYIDRMDKISITNFKERKCEKTDEKLSTTMGIALDRNAYFPPFEFPNGSIFLFASIESKKISPYQYWGRLKLLNGQLKYVRLWAFSALKDVTYYKGYALDRLEALHTVYSPPTNIDIGYIVLFNHPKQGESENGIPEPHLTGKLYLESETVLLTIWRKEGLKGIYFSGTVDVLKVDNRI